MVDFLDMLRCPVCGAFYDPKTTVTGRTIPHCPLPIDHPLSRGQIVEMAAIEMDLSVIEARVVGYLLTDGIVGSRLTDIVDPPLTGSLLDIEV